MARGGKHKQALPAPFHELAACFEPDIEPVAETPDALAHGMATGFSDEERAVLRAFLTEIARSASAEALRQMWGATSTRWRFADGEELRALLAVAPDKLGQGRARPGWAPVGDGKTHGRRVSPRRKRR